MQLTMIGNGAMAKSIVLGLPEKYEITVVGRSEEKLQIFANECGCGYALLDDYDISDQNVIFAVKPHVLEQTAAKLRGKAKVLFSVLAGTTLAQLQNAIKAQYYIRTMPNVGATYNASTTTLTGDVSQKELSIELFSSIGKAVWVDSEKELDIATALAGSGPAFLALAAEAMADAAVKCGMRRDLAKEFTANNFYSFAKLIENENPADIKDKICSPAGTTIEGVKALEDNGARKAFFSAVEKAYERLQK